MLLSLDQLPFTSPGHQNKNYKGHMKLTLIITALLSLNSSISILAMGADLSTIEYEVAYQRNLEEKVKTNEELLLAATVTNKYEEVKKLLDKGTYVNFTSEHGRTALHLAALKNFINIAQLLLDHGAFIDGKDIFQRTPLFLACENGHAKMVKLLLNHNANPNNKD